MKSEDLLGLASRLKSCHAKLVERQQEIAPNLNRPTVTVAGFGNKGRPLASYLRDIAGKEVKVYDASATGRIAAEDAGFAVYESRDQINQEDAVILAACQHQIEQADQFPTGHVYYEEAAFFFNTPTLFDHSRDFPQWIIDNWEIVVEFTGGLPQPARGALERVLRFRLSLDPQELGPARRPVSGMWFDIPAEFKRREYKCFLDVGAYDGDTLDAATQWNLGFAKAIAVEANPDFGKEILKREHLFADGLQVVPSAAWSKSCRLNASQDLGGMVSVTESEAGNIVAEPLDNVVTTSVDFLKMDIEGAEASALNGAKNILRAGTDLAIAAYHRPEDILSLFQIVSDCLTSFDEYSFHIAHYSDCLDDTIYYFLSNRGD